VLAVQNGVARKVRVTFLQKDEARIVNGREKRKASPVAGRQYVAEATEAGLRVTDASGGDVSHAEGEVLAQLYRGLGQPEAMARAAAARPMRVGEPVPALADALKADLQRVLEGRVWFGAVSVTPTGTRVVDGVDCVAFAVAIQLGNERPERTASMDLKGELLVRTAEGWPVLLDLSGPVRVELRESGVLAHGSGTERLTGAYAYP
jgi:hypothetical protein